ncbi:MAG: DUF1566 domain-containing protein [Methylococcaceae bacterium]
MIKHPFRPFIYSILLFFSLSYPITSFAAWAAQVTTGDKQVILRWLPIKTATNYGVCYATETIADINNCLNYADGTWQNMTGTTVKIANLTNGKKYYFRVLAENTKRLETSDSIGATPLKPALNDTGITTCSDDANNNLPCPVSGYPNQDAQSGRDVSKNNNGNGHAGFDFTKISSTGTTLTATATSWSCIKDNVTGLMWEVKTDDNGLHDKDWRYSWYEPDNTKNGGFAGYQYYGTCGNAGACDTDTYIKAVNTAGWCGYKDWRIPGEAELHSIVDYSRNNPAIDTTYFPNTVSTWFWSSSSYSNFGSLYAWFVHFNGGYDNHIDKSHSYAVRLVRQD